MNVSGRNVILSYRQAALLLCEAYLASCFVINGSGSWLYLVLIPVFAAALYWIERSTKTRWYVILCALLFAVCSAAGAQYVKSDNLLPLYAGRKACLHTLVSISGMFVLLHAALRFLNSALEGTLSGGFLLSCGTRKEKRAKLHPYLTHFLLLFAVWLPHLIINYPGRAMGDTRVQLGMYLGIPNEVTASVTLMDPSVLITNHHPVLHTLLLGWSLTLGRSIFHSDNAGHFIYICIQYLIMVSAVACVTWWMERRFSGKWFRICAVCFYFFFPVFLDYLVLSTKDTVYTGFLMVYTVMTADLLYDRERAPGRKWIAGYFAIIFLCVLFRRNGFLTFFLSMPFAILAGKRHRKLLTAAFAAMVGFNIIYSNLVLPAAKISSASPRVIYSVPFQQTARFVMYYEEEITPEEKEAIDAVMEYDKIADTYNPWRAEPVMRLYRTDQEEGQMIAYLQTWFRMFLRHPFCYIQAALCAQDGFYSFGEKVPARYGIASSKKRFDQANAQLGTEFSYPAVFRAVRNLEEKLIGLSRKVPVLVQLYSSALYNWIIVFLLFYALGHARWRLWAMLMPSVMMLLVAFMGPVNARYYFRYEYPVAAVLPLILGAAIYLEGKAK